MKCKSKPNNQYNGWRNWETWNVALWLDNEPLYKKVQARVRGSSFSLTAQDAKELVLGLLPHGTPDFESAEPYSRVDWQEIAEALTSE